LAFEHDTTNLGVLVFERKIQMAGSICLQAGNLAFDLDRIEMLILLQVRCDIAIQFGDTNRLVIAGSLSSG
jgi:hypothetical protein